jgi:hypothetical protein
MLGITIMCLCSVLFGMWLGKTLYAKNKKKFVSPIILKFKPRAIITMTDSGACVDSSHLKERNKTNAD